MTDQSEDKAYLRRRAKEYRRSLLPEEKARLDKLVTDNLFALGEFKDAKTVLCYVSSSREVDTSCIIKQAVLSGKTVAVPRCVDAFGHMEFCRIDSVFDLEPGAFGIMEPHSTGSCLFRGRIPCRLRQRLLRQVFTVVFGHENRARIRRADNKENPA